MFDTICRCWLVDKRAIFGLKLPLGFTGSVQKFRCSNIWCGIQNGRQ